jgi:hypothetical protein
MPSESVFNSRKGYDFFFFLAHLNYKLQQKAVTTALPKGSHPENQDSSEQRHLRTTI